MVNSAVLKAIEAEKKETVVSYIQDLRTFLIKKADDDDLSKCDVSEFIDEFMRIKKLDTTEPLTSSKKKTFYTHFSALKIAEIKEKEKDYDEDDKTPPNTYMNVIGSMWREYKDTDKFKKDKEKWIKETFPDSSAKKEPKKEPKKDPKKEPKKTIKKKKKQEPTVIMLDSDSDDE